MSLASLNVKVTKGKQKILPKLKTILANPYKSECASLDASELQSLKELISEEISNSDLEPRAFATAQNISIGLESVLRAINNSRCSCVFIALSIKPRHVVHLIARNTEVKNPRAPVYLVPELELLTEQVFGVRTLAFSFPVATDRLSLKLQDWIGSRQKKVKAKQIQPKTTATKRKISSKYKDLPLAEPKKELIISDKIEKPNQEKWSGDFISFSSSSQNIEASDLQLDTDKNELLDELSKMTKKVVTTIKVNVCEDKNEPIKTRVDVENENEESQFEMDDFLQDYQPLEVHKIRPNPNKKAKKKRQKSKKQSL